jgi:hypothetical protein
MKTFLKIISSACLLATLVPLALAQAEEPARGGGGVLQNGKYMSFYSAGLYAEPSPVVMTEVPNLNTLVNFLNQFEYLSQETKLKWINLILPSGSHQYYRAQNDKLSPEIQDRLLEEYARLTKQPKASIRLFAITDTNSRVTFLLPDFYKLSALDQMGILVHEAMWLVYPQTDYSFIVNAEMAVEAAIDQPTNTARVNEALKFLGTPIDRMILAVKADTKSHALKELMNKNGTVSLAKLFGPAWVKCMDDRTEDECFRFSNQVMYRNILAHPQSLLLRNIYDSMTAPAKSLTVAVDKGDDDDYFVSTWNSCSIRLKVDEGSPRSGHYGKLFGTCTIKKRNPYGAVEGQPAYIYKEAPLVFEMNGGAQ